jgi:glycosyltransferase involved in cell wall biosynthesis
MKASVIVPVYNAAHEIEGLAERLLGQTFPADDYEILLVDNGSTDGTIGKLEALAARCAPRLRFLKEHERRGSYAARNKGLSVARGEILAFTDSDCTPVAAWLEEGIRCLESTPADLAGGHVRFTYPAGMNGAELVDATTNMQMKLDIETQAVTKTANLFTYRRVFDAIGLFPDHMQSGGDVWWTKKATSAGFKLVFAGRAEVSHPARSWREMIRKQLRVGYGHPPVMRARGKTWGFIIGESFRLLLPPKWKYMKDRFAFLEPEVLRQKKGSIRFARWVCRVATVAGRVRRMAAMPFERQRLERVDAPAGE